MTTLRAYDGHRPALGERVYVDPAAVVIGRVVLGDDHIDEGVQPRLGQLAHGLVMDRVRAHARHVPRCTQCLEGLDDTRRPP